MPFSAEEIQQGVEELQGFLRRGKIALADLRYQLFYRRAKRHGHLAVYKIKFHEIPILYIVRSAQDWQTALDADECDQL